MMERQNRHVVYKLPNGRRVTLSKTPSDHRECLNAISDLKKAARG